MSADLDFLEEPQAADVPDVTPVAPEPQGTGEPVTPPVTPQEPIHHAPLTALLDEREKRQRAEAEAAELRKWRDEQERKAQDAAQRPIDLLEDPEGRLRHERQQVQAEMANYRLNTSEMLARQVYGDAEVDAARAAFVDAASKDPALGFRITNHIHAYDEAVKWYRKQKVLSEIGEDPNAWREREREAIRAALMAELGAQPAAPQKQRFPGSLASAPAVSAQTQPSSRSDLPELFG